MKTLVKLLPVFLFLTIISSCKKEEEPTPEAETPTLIIWATHSSANSEGIIVQVTKGSEMWTGVISATNSAAPACFSSDNFTLELQPGTYTIEGVSSAGTYTWGPTVKVISAGSGCNNLKLE